MNHFISLKEAKAMIGRYKTEKDQIVKQEYVAENILSFSETFDRDAFDTLLSQEGCTGLRFHYGMHETMQVSLIAVAVDVNGDAILMPRSSELDEDTIYNDIVEKGQHCPPHCSTNDPF